MSKQCLDVHQMQHLQEMGLNTNNASMVWCKYDGEEEYSRLLPRDEDVFERCLAVKFIPAYTLQDVLDALPKNVSSNGKYYYLTVDLDAENIYYGTNFGFDLLKGIVYRSTESLIDAAYELFCWCVEMGFVETNKNK